MEKNGGAPQNFKSGSALKGLDKLNHLISAWFERVAMVGIVGIIIATLIDVIGAKIFNKPLAAGTEVVYFLQIVAIAGALASTKIDGKHIRLEFVDSLPKRIKSTFNFIVAVLGLGLFILLAWKSFEYAQTLRSTHEVTATSRVPLFPFVLWIALCCIPLCLVLLQEMVKSAIEVVKK
ncbi:MAG: TRAP transporter small permease [Peptococcaceae bacterium]|nr:TRAP transporter small permease [Peptococcaceae bacterium]